MKKTMSFLSLALSVLLCLTLLTGCASAAGGAEPSVEQISSVGGQIAVQSNEADNSAERQPAQTPQLMPPAVSASLTYAAAPAVTATPTASSVLVNGETVRFDAYNIDGNNFFKLRDLAEVLRGSEKQIEVTWDGAKNAINLISGAAYTSVGGELAQGDGTAKNAAPTTSALYLDGKKLELTAYNIGGNNYFKLRDLGAALDFDVAWDGDRNTIIIDGNNSYGTWEANPSFGDVEFTPEDVQYYAEYDNDTNEKVWDHVYDDFADYEGEKEGYTYIPGCGYFENGGPAQCTGSIEPTEEELEASRRLTEEMEERGVIFH